MATTQTSFGIVSLSDGLAEAEDDHGFVGLRRRLDVGAFGVSAQFQRKAGEFLVREHDDAPQGTAIFVRDPDTKRSAVATADDTIVLAVGGRRGEAYRLGPAAAADGFFDAYQAKNYATALEATNRGLEVYPGNAFLLYNVACMSALLGDRETALTALAESVAKWEPYKELARGDDDFESVREDPKFLELIAA